MHRPIWQRPRASLGRLHEKRPCRASADLNGGSTQCAVNKLGEQANCIAIGATEGVTRVLGGKLTRAEGAALQACLSKASSVSYSVVPAASCKWQMEGLRGVYYPMALW